MLQPKFENPIVPEIRDYQFLKLKGFLTQECAPTIPDSIWTGVEEKKALAKLRDKEGEVDLFSV
jgi:hypothetical protein